MANGLAALEAEIGRRLAAARAADNPNLIEPAQLRAWATAYLRDHDLDVTGPKRRHWNLWMREERSADGLFAVLVFGPGGVEFFCGTGSAFDVRWFCTVGCPADPAAVYPAMRNWFAIPAEPLRLDRPTAEAWLGRPRPF